MDTDTGAEWERIIPFEEWNQRDRDKNFYAIINNRAFTITVNFYAIFTRKKQYV